MGDQVTDTCTDNAPTADDDMSWPFEEKSAHAEWLNTSERTLDSWRNVPDGLPHAYLGRRPIFNGRGHSSGSNPDVSRITRLR
jgi:hypothetical protein